MKEISRIKQNSLLLFLAGVLVMLGLVVALPAQAHAADSGEWVEVHRLVASGTTNDHMLTVYPKESLASLNKTFPKDKWKDETKVIGKSDMIALTAGWYAPEKSSTPVYRLYNSKPAKGKRVTHYYTTSKTDRDAKIKAGWVWESKNYKGKGEGAGGAFYSSDTKKVPVYQLYNTKTQQYLYTFDTNEVKTLTSKYGWKNQGIKFYGASTSRGLGSLYYNGNGATSGTENGKEPYGDYPSLYTYAKVGGNTYVKNGYTFTGWNTKANGSGTTYKPGDKILIKGSVTLYAQWKNNQYAIRFNSNAPSGTTALGTMSPVSTTYGKTFNLPANKFSVKGYTFAGWSKTAKGKVEYKDKASVKNLTSNPGSITLYAIWSKNAGSNTTTKPVTTNPTTEAETYTVQFNPNGGTGTMDNQTVGVTSSVSLKANAFVRSGYAFTGWNTTSNGTGKAYANKASISKLASANGSVTLYAQWKKTEAAPTTGGSSKSSSKPEDKTLSGVSYQANGGRGMTFNTSTEGVGQPYTTAKNPYCRTGYKFVEWNTKADGTGTSYEQKQTFKLQQANMTLYAIWIAN